MNIIGLNLYSYCLNNVVVAYDPLGSWVLAVGIEAQAAFVIGGYAGIAVNIDEKWNISVTYSLGFAIITNAAAYIQAYVAFYQGKNDVSQLQGWGVSVGASFSMGAHISAGGSLDIGFDGSVGGNFNIGYGAGISIAPIPYFQVKIGCTGTFVTDNLLEILKKWTNNEKKTYSILSLKIQITKHKKHITIYIKSMGTKISIYKKGKMTVK